MYQVFYGEFLLHDLRADDYYLGDPKLKEELNRVSEFTFNIYPNHPHFDKLQKLSPQVFVKKDDNFIFKGRIIKDEQGMDNSKQVICEGPLAFLLDTIVRPFSFQSDPSSLFQFFVNSHNTQVGTFEKTDDTAIVGDKIYFKYNDTNSLYEQVIDPNNEEISLYYEATGDKILYIGKITGANLDSNSYINRSSSDYTDTFSSIEDKLLNTVGGYLIERYVGGNIFVDWVDDFVDGESQLVSTQVIEFGENLLDIAVENDASETYSVVIPLGAEIEQEDGTKTRLNITEVNNGKDYLVNEDALAAYGWITAPVDETTWNDVTLPENLKSKAEEFLNNQAIMLKSTIEVNALDLNTINKSIMEFKMGLYIKLQSTPHNISKLYLLTKKETPLNKPENMEITLGETAKTFTGIQMGEQQGTLNKIGTILDDYVLNKELPSIVNEKIENSSYIQQIPSQVMIEVSKTYSSKSDLEELLETVNTNLTQTESDWTFEFNKIVQQITNVDGTVNANYQELIKYIRFIDGKIVLGEIGNDITLELQNDRLSFYNNNLEVAYITDGRIYITDGVFTNSLQIGIFALLPRRNGNLSFKRIRGE